jgi:hypothetical protein
MEEIKSKLETAKDATTAVNGLIENTTTAMDLCEMNFANDFGLYQVRALLKLAKMDLEFLIAQLSYPR